MAIAIPDGSVQLLLSSGVALDKRRTGTDIAAGAVLVSIAVPPRWVGSARRPVNVAVAPCSADELPGSSRYAGVPSAGVRALSG